MATISKSDFSSGLSHKVVCAWADAEGNPDELNKFAENTEMVRKVLRVIRGQSEIKEIEYIIDCDADPYLPDGWEVEEHQKQGMIKWTASLISLYLAKGQQNGKVLEGNKLRKELVGKSVLNANVLDFLLSNPHLIPEEWKGKYVFFWGTIYRNSDGRLCVRCLCWNGVKWSWSYNWLGYDWNGRSPSALRASN